MIFFKCPAQELSNVIVFVNGTQKFASLDFREVWWGGDTTYIKSKYFGQKKNSNLNSPPFPSENHWEMGIRLVGLGSSNSSFGNASQYVGAP